MVWFKLTIKEVFFLSFRIDFFLKEALFLKGIFLREALFPKEVKGFFYSGELKLILMMYMVQVCKGNCFFFMEVYVLILFLGEGCVFTVKVAFCNWG